MNADKYVPEDSFYTDRKTVKYKWNMGSFHYHNSYEIYYLEKGSRKMLVQDKVYELHEGDIMLLRPNVSHRSMHSGPHTRINIVFTDDFIVSYFSKAAAEYMLSCFDEEFIRLDSNKTSIFMSLYRKILEDKKNGRPYFISLADILDLFISAKERQAKETAVTNTAFSPKVGAVIDYICQNYNTISSIDDIADACFMNKSYLCRLFKKEIGMTVFEYLNNIRIHNACDMLRNTVGNITDIAVSCGFSSVSYFSYAFKGTMGCTPSQFRKNV